jgi:hypothetical protein
MKTVWIYVNTCQQVGDHDHLKVFANADAAETWFAENDPEGVAFVRGSGMNKAALARRPYFLGPSRNHALAQFVFPTSSCRIRVDFSHIARGQPH